MKLLEHVKKMYAAYVILVGIMTASIAGYKVYDSVMTELQTAKSDISFSQMLIYEFMIESIEEKYPSNDFTDLEWKYYSIKAAKLQTLQAKFNRDSGWVKKERK